MTVLQLLFGLVMVVLLSGCANRAVSTAGEGLSPSGERLGGQAGLPQEDVALEALRYREEARALLQAARALEEEAKALEAKSIDGSSVARKKVDLARQYRQAADEASAKANERQAQIVSDMTQ